MNKKKTIYLHIGSPKTGTTSLQLFLRANKEQLETDGFFFPTPYPLPSNFEIPCSSNISELLYEHIINDNSLELRPIKSPLETKKIWKEKFLPIIKKSSAEKIILSFEDLFYMGIELVDLFLEDGFLVKVIAYIRKPAEYIASLYCQWVKQGFIQDNFMDFVDHSIFGINHYEYIIPYIDKLGKDNVMIYPYEKEQWKNNDLIDDFLFHIGINNTENYKKNKNQNISISRNKAELMRLINLLNFDYNTSFKFNVKLKNARSCEENPPLEIIKTLSDKEIKYITDKYMPIIDNFCKILIPDKKLFQNNYPPCYGKDRPVYDKFNFSMEELEILNEALVFNKQEKEKIQLENAALGQKCRVLANKNKIKFDYYKCRLLANLTFGKRKQHYIEKKHYLKNELEILR